MGIKEQLAIITIATMTIIGAYILMNSFIYDDIMPVGEPITEWNPESKEYTIKQAFKTEPANKYDKIGVNCSFYKKGKIIGSKHAFIVADGSRSTIIVKLPEEPDIFEFQFLSAENFSANLF